MRVLDLVFLGGVLLALAARAETYYVAPHGDDSQAGTSNAPFRTLMRGAMAAGPGDTVMVRNGRYGHESAVTGGDSADFAASPVVLRRSGTPDAWITFQAEHKGKAVLDCEMVCDSYINLLNASYIVIQGFVITRGYREGIHSNDAAHHITLRGNRFEYIANRDASTGLGLDGMYTNPNCHDFVIDGNIFHDIGRTNASQLDHALYLRGANFAIVNNIFYNIQHGWAIQAAQGLSNVLIANNTFAFPGANKGSHIMLWRIQTDITIRNNIFYSPGSPAADNYAITRWTSLVSNCSIDHNVVYGTVDVLSSSYGCSMSENLQGSDPQFVRASSPPYNFRLKSTSPAIHAGAPIPGLSVDFDGSLRPQDSANDAGAHQYSQAHLRSPRVLPAWLGFLGAQSLAFMNFLDDLGKPLRDLIRALRDLLLCFLAQLGLDVTDFGAWCDADG